VEFVVDEFTELSLKGEEDCKNLSTIEFALFLLCDVLWAYLLIEESKEELTLYGGYWNHDKGDAMKEFCIYTEYFIFF
jgi:hypothetical protein